MKYFILALTLFSCSSLVANAQDAGKGNLTAMQNPMHSEIANVTEKEQEPAVKPASDLDKASIKMIDELTEKLYLQRKKRWQKEVGTLTMN